MAFDAVIAVDCARFGRCAILVGGDDNYLIPGFVKVNIPRNDYRTVIKGTDAEVLIDRSSRRLRL
jgi:hypothetical protein